MRFYEENFVVYVTVLDKDMKEMAQSVSFDNRIDAICNIISSHSTSFLKRIETFVVYETTGNGISTDHMLLPAFVLGLLKHHNRSDEYHKYSRALREPMEIR